jgi:hypothetical protein
MGVLFWASCFMLVVDSRTSKYLLKKYPVAQTTGIEDFRAVHLLYANGGRTLFVEPFTYQPPTVGEHYFLYCLLYLIISIMSIGKFKKIQIFEFLNNLTHIDNL